MTKKAISQRWDEDLIDEMKILGELTGRSITQLTIEALEILKEILKETKIQYMKPAERKDFIIKTIQNEINQVTQYDVQRSKRRTHPPGLVIERIRSHLKNNPNFKFSTTQISDQLEIPLSTVRAYIREIANQDTKMKIIPGRPNHIIFVKN